MKAYFLGVGSNLDAERHIPEIIRALLQIDPALAVSRVVKTEPVGMQSSNLFLNLTARLESDLMPSQLKQQLNGIEERLGRDRSDPLSKVKDRPADIDILFAQEQPFVRADQLPDEVYLRPILLELLYELGIQFDAPMPTLSRGERLLLDGCTFGLQPTFFTLTDGKITAQTLSPCLEKVLL